MDLNKIADGFIDLLTKIPYSKITVQMICDNTPVSRNAFYYHFKKKENLVEWICYQDYMKHCYPFFRTDLAGAKGKTFFLQIKRRSDFYTAIFKADDGELLYRCLCKAYSDGATKENIVEYINPPRKPVGSRTTINLNYFKYYISSGVAAVVVGWIRGGMKTPIDTMANDMTLLLTKSPDEIVAHHLI